MQSSRWGTKLYHQLYNSCSWKLKTELKYSIQMQLQKNALNIPLALTLVEPSHLSRQRVSWKKEDVYLQSLGMGQSLLKPQGDVRTDIPTVANKSTANCLISSIGTRRLSTTGTCFSGAQNSCPKKQGQQCVGNNSSYPEFLA